MTDGPNNLILRQLRAMELKLDRLADDVREVKGRLSALEHRLGRAVPPRHPQAT